MRKLVAQTNTGRQKRILFRRSQKKEFNKILNSLPILAVGIGLVAQAHITFADQPGTAQIEKERSRDCYRSTHFASAMTAIGGSITLETRDYIDMCVNPENNKVDYFALSEGKYITNKRVNVRYLFTIGVDRSDCFEKH